MRSGPFGTGAWMALMALLAAGWGCRKSDGGMAARDGEGSSAVSTDDGGASSRETSAAAIAAGDGRDAVSADAPRASDVPPAVTSAARPQPEEPEPSVVTLLEPGAAPLEPLRFRPVAGATTRVEVVNSAAMTLSLPGMPGQEMNLPETRLPMVVRIVSVNADGSFVVEAMLEAPIMADAPPGLGDALSAGMELIAGATTRMELTAQGAVRRAEMNLGREAPAGVEAILDEVNKAIAQLATQFPEEPVGLGAQWITVNHLTLMGIRVRQAATYRLVERQGGTLTLAISLNQSAESQRMVLPGVPAGNALTLERLEAEGGGALSLDLGRLVPFAGSTDVRQSMALSGKVGGAERAVSLSMRLHSEIRLVEGRDSPQP